MEKIYLVTGASGHVGTVLVGKLLERGERVRILAYEPADMQDGRVEVCRGDIRDPGSLGPFFDRSGWDAATLIHCAARITIASRDDPAVWDTNVNGTANVLDAAFRAGVERTVYVSSVHAIPERLEPETITEVDSFSPELVYGQYARSKAAAAQIALDYAARGMNLSIVHPSGIIGPGDRFERNHMIRTVRAMADGRIPAAIEGGYDFVDSRDVAGGILACEKLGRTGECYILNGSYISVLDLINKIRAMKGRRPVKTELPYALARAVAPMAEKLAILRKRQPLLTPYSVYTLHTNGKFSHDKASREFGYSPRSIDESLRDSFR